MNDVSLGVHAKDLRLMTHDELIAEISRLRAAVTTYGQHKAHCAATINGESMMGRAALMMRGLTSPVCDCGFEALNAPESTKKEATRSASSQE